MAVFTEVTLAQAATWTRRHFGFTAVSALSPIAEGIENTNYLLVANAQRYVFTIFEIWDRDMTDYYATLMRHLSANGAPVPAPLSPATAEGCVWNDKPCLLTPFVEGAWLSQPTTEKCRKMGATIADLHRASASFSINMSNPRGATWRRQTAEQLREVIPAQTWDVLHTALNRDSEFNELPLPTAACHCDLFRNNVLWQNGDIAGVIDFYFGGEDTLIFDLAVCACDWCFDHTDGIFMDSHLTALINGYEDKRMLCDLERACFHNALQTAALRFWVSRLYDWHFPRDARMLAPHDPRQFENIFLQARQTPPLTMTTQTQGTIQ